MNSLSLGNPLQSALRTPSRPAPAAEMVDLKGSNCKWTSDCQKQRGAVPNQHLQVSMYLKSSDDSGVKAFAEANGLKVTSFDPKTKTVKLDGSVAQYQKAFGMKLSEYKDKAGNQYRGYDGALKLPASLADNVQGVLGFDNHPIAHTNFIIGKKAGVAPNDMGGYNPPDVGAMYNFPKGLDGTGQTISIIELGGGYNESDLQQYFQGLGIKEPKVNAIGVDGATNEPEGTADGADGEVGLDIEVAGSIAPGATINVYFAPNTDQGFVDALNQAAKDQASTGNGPVSISWGAPESQWSDQATSTFNDALKNASQEGVNVFSASGDNGSVDGEKDKANHADFPASSPWGIGTGGTTLQGSNGVRQSESAWNDGMFGGSGGGGVSNDFGVPDFQKGLPGLPKPTNDKGGRGVPDVSGNASPTTGYNVLVDGQAMPIGGTSAVAPLYAGLTALLGQGVGQPLGQLNPFFYAHPNDFNDITDGNNGGFQAGPGWDAVTGLGSPDGTKLLADLKAAHGQKA